MAGRIFEKLKDYNFMIGHEHVAFFKPSSDNLFEPCQIIEVWPPPSSAVAKEELLLYLYSPPPSPNLHGLF